MVKMVTHLKTEIATPFMNLHSTDMFLAESQTNYCYCLVTVKSRVDSRPDKSKSKNLMTDRSKAVDRSVVVCYVTLICVSVGIQSYSDV